MPKSKPKKKASEKKDSFTQESDKDLKENGKDLKENGKDFSESNLPSEEQLDENLDDPELSTEEYHQTIGLRLGLEIWKMIKIGKPLISVLSKAFVAYNLKKPFNTDIIFEQIERMNIDAVNMELFEESLFSKIDAFLAKRKASK